MVRFYVLAHRGMSSNSSSLPTPSVYFWGFTLWRLLLPYGCTHMATVGVKGLIPGRENSSKSNTLPLYVKVCVSFKAVFCYYFCCQLNKTCLRFGLSQVPDGVKAELSVVGHHQWRFLAGVDHILARISNKRDLRHCACSWSQFNNTALFKSNNRSNIFFTQLMFNMLIMLMFMFTC